MVTAARPRVRAHAKTSATPLAANFAHMLVCIALPLSATWRGIITLTQSGQLRREFIISGTGAREAANALKRWAPNDNIKIHFAEFEGTYNTLPQQVDKHGRLFATHPSHQPLAAPGSAQSVADTADAVGRGRTHAARRSVPGDSARADGDIPAPA